MSAPNNNNKSNEEWCKELPVVDHQLFENAFFCARRLENFLFDMKTANEAKEPMIMYYNYNGLRNISNALNNCFQCGFKGVDANDEKLLNDEKSGMNVIGEKVFKHDAKKVQKKRAQLRALRNNIKEEEEEAKKRRSIKPKSEKKKENDTDSEDDNEILNIPKKRRLVKGAAAVKLPLKQTKIQQSPPPPALPKKPTRVLKPIEVEDKSLEPHPIIDPKEILYRIDNNSLIDPKLLDSPNFSPVDVSPTISPAEGKKALEELEREIEEDRRKLEEERKQKVNEELERRRQEEERNRKAEEERKMREQVARKARELRKEEAERQNMKIEEDRQKKIVDEKKKAIEEKKRKLLEEMERKKKELEDEMNRI